MTILVFGKTGQVARELLADARVLALGRQEADLSVPDSCIDAIRSRTPAAVINAAAYTSVDKAEEEEDLATLVNGAAPTAMARTCAALDIPFVHLSTDYVFAGTGVKAWNADDRPFPISAYGRSKLIGEKGVRAAGGRHAILRTSWIFSSHGNNFLKTMLRLSEARSELKVVADQIGGPTPAEAIAKACIGISEKLNIDASTTGTYHFSGTPDTSWACFARAIFAVAGKKMNVHSIPTSAYPTPASRPLNSRLDCSATKAAFGIARPDWRPELPKIVQQIRHKEG